MRDCDPKELKFIDGYLEHGVGSKAVIDAGYSATGASVTANRLLKRPHIAAKIARRRQVTEKKSALSAEKIFDALNNLVDFDIGQCFGADGKLLPIKEIPLEARKALSAIDLSKPGGSIKASSRLGAIELSAKLLGMVKQEQVQQQAVQIIIAPPPSLPEVTVEHRQLKPEWE
jgi:phage terminase small subunit